MFTRKIQSFHLKSPTSIFLIVALAVFVSEATVMLLLYYLPHRSILSEAMVDATMLVALVSPALYFFLFRPLVVHIRDREMIEEVLHKNEEEQFKVMIRTSLDAFLTTDLSGHIIEVNDAYCQMMGYSREELLTMNVADTEVADTSEETESYFNKLLEKGSNRFEARKRRKDGHIQIVEVSSNYSRTGLRRGSIPARRPARATPPTSPSPTRTA